MKKKKNIIDCHLQRRKKKNPKEQETQRKIEIESVNSQKKSLDKGSTWPTSIHHWPSEIGEHRNNALELRLEIFEQEQKKNKIRKHFTCRFKNGKRISTVEKLRTITQKL